MPEVNETALLAALPIAADYGVRCHSADVGAPMRAADAARAIIAAYLDALPKAEPTLELSPEMLAAYEGLDDREKHAASQGMRVVAQRPVPERGDQ